MGSADEQRAKWRAYKAERRAQQKALGVKLPPGKTSGGKSTNAERQRRWRERKKAKAADQPEPDA